MEPNENMEVQDESFESEDLLMEGLTEEPQDDSLDLEDEFETEQQQPSQQGTTEQRQEPGYVRRRIDEAVTAATKSMQEELSALRAQLEPLRQYQMDMEAQELVRSGKVKDLETAKELVRYRQGQPQTPKAESQPRNDKGQFTSQQDDTPSPETQARIDMLQHQVNRIKERGGPDVTEEFRNNPEVREKIISGEMDFYDVAEQMQRPKKKPSSPKERATP